MFQGNMRTQIIHILKEMCQQLLNMEGGRGIQEGDKESAEKNEKYVIEDNFIVDTRGNKNYSKIISTTKT